MELFESAWTRVEGLPEVEDNVASLTEVGTYRLGEELGRGEFAVVQRCTNAAGAEYAPLGLLDMLNAGGAVKAATPTETGVSVEASLLPPGYDKRDHVTPSGRKYQTFTNEAGKQLRSRLEAWRDYKSRHGAHDSDTDYVPYNASPGTSAEPEPTVLFDVATPGGAGPSNGVHNQREPLSAMARRLSAERRRESSSIDTLSLPFGATCSLVELDSDQCGNPNCMVKSKNGLHPGDCRFPAPRPRR